MLGALVLLFTHAFQLENYRLIFGSLVQCGAGVSDGGIRYGLGASKVRGGLQPPALEFSFCFQMVSLGFRGGARTSPTGG